MSAGLDGTVAVVTGASSGIGEATARQLARDGASVVVAARRRDRLDALVAQIVREGGAAVAIECDVTSGENAAAMVQRAVDEFGRLDTLVNNAGVMLLGPIVGAPIDEWNRMVDLNMNGLLACTHAALPHLLSAAETSPRGVADVVNISSVAGRVVRAGSGVYNMTKFGVGAFSESLRQEVTKRNVRVALVEPGAVATELSSHIRDEIREGMLSVFAGVERLQASDIAQAVSYIVSQPRRVAINEILIRPTDQES